MSESSAHTSTPAAETSLPPRIAVLSPLVASQIAAGEVVERPASVVKELVENSLDAGATRITVDLEQGGVELIRITDDGRGIPADQLSLAIAPHATSKVRSVEDLDRIATLGFRGEALASIASVSRLSIRSRPPSSDSAAEIHAEGLAPALPGSGPHHTPVPVAGAVGTVVTVRTLFFNTPARRKFLKGTATELGRCLDTLRDLALAHPSVGFLIRSDSRTVLELPPGQDVRERAIDVLGRDVESELLEVNADRYDDARGVVLWGLIGRPSLARATNRSQHLFVNGRPIRDKTIQHAILHSFRGLIEPGRYPTAVLMLEMSPQAVDVNVHPAKAEVRFRDSGLVHSVITRALSHALKLADLTPTFTPAPFQGAATHDGRGPGYLGDRAVLPTATPGNFAEPPPDPRAGAQAFVDYFRRLSAPPSPPLTSPPITTQESAVSSAALDPSSGSAELTPPYQPAEAENSSPSAPLGFSSEPLPANDPASGPFVPVVHTLPVSIRPVDRVLQVHNSYLVTQDEQGVVIVDQHALHERAMFEALLARVSMGPLESQSLLAPIVVDASAEQVASLNELAPLLERIGIVADPLGPRQIAVRAFPSFLFSRGVEPSAFLADLFALAERDEFGRPDPSSAAGTNDLRAAQERALRDVLDMMACKAAVKAGDRMSEGELDELLRLRGAVERSSNCPHGRPTSIRLTIRELERLFGRS